MKTAYLYANAVLYVLFAAWCTVAANKTARSLGYLKLSAGGQSEYLVVYGGLQFGLALMFWLLARDSQLHRSGLLISICLYGGIVAFRVTTVASYWPVGAVTLVTGALEAALLIVAAVLYLKY